MKLQPAKQTGFYDACRQHNIIGTGWDPNGPQKSPDDIEQAHRAAGRTTKSGRLRHELRYIIHGMNSGEDGSPSDYVWVNEGSKYAICKVKSECVTSYDVKEELREDLTNENGAQIYNIRRVEWTDVPVNFVPGYVQRKFTGRFGTLNKMKTGVDADAKRVIQHLHSIDDFDTERSVSLDKLQSAVEALDADTLFSILDADDTEELVLDYLQSKGWRLTKYSTGDSQATYECELRRVTDQNRETAYVQVKSGSATVDPQDYTELAKQGRVFLFSNLMGTEEDSIPQNISVLEPNELMQHLQENLGWLPMPTLLRLSTSI